MDILGAPGSWSHTEPWVPWVTGNSDFPVSHRTPGSRSLPELRVPGVTTVSVGHPELSVPGDAWNSEFPDLPGFSGSLILPELWIPVDARNSVLPESNWKNWYTDFRVTTRTLISGDSVNPWWLREPVVSCTWWLRENRSYGWLREPRSPGDSGIPEFRTPSRTQFPFTPGIRSSGWIMESWVSPGTPFPGDSGNSEWLEEPGLPGDNTGSPLFRVPVDSGNPEVLLTPGFLCFRWLWEPGSPGDSGNHDFLEASWTRSFGDSSESPGTPGSCSHQELRIPGFTQNSGFPKTPRTPGSLCSGWLREPEVTTWTRGD